MKWETMHAIIQLYLVAYAILLMMLILIVDGGPVKTGIVVGLCVVYMYALRSVPRFLAVCKQN